MARKRTFVQAHRAKFCANVSCGIVNLKPFYSTTAKFSHTNPTYCVLKERSWEVSINEVPRIVWAGLRVTIANIPTLRNIFLSSMTSYLQKKSVPPKVPINPSLPSSRSMCAECRRICGALLDSSQTVGTARIKLYSTDRAGIDEGRQSTKRKVL